MAVLVAHGGLQNWVKAIKITARMSLVARSDPPGVTERVLEQTVTIDPHREHIKLASFTAPNLMSVLDVDPEQVAITTRDGSIVEERVNPRESFPTALYRHYHALGCDSGGVLHECGCLELPH